MEAVGNSTFGNEFYHVVHHITASCHYKPDIFVFLKHFCSSFNKIFRTLLHCDSSEESYHLFSFSSSWEIEQLIVETA